MKKDKIIVFLAVCSLLFLPVGAALLQGREGRTDGRGEEIQPKQKEAASSAGICAIVWETVFASELMQPGIYAVPLTPDERAALVYTFLQGPRAYRERLPWSGEWCQKIVKGNSFGSFGCGLCCMANIYSTLTDFTCSPWDMYEYAVSASSYYPSRESGAIGWEDMRTVLRSLGFSCGIYVKPDTYEAFRQQMKESRTAIALVSSAYDDAFWRGTPGHYVNLWLYQEDTDMVFLAEPGDPENNRTWIPLRYVYDALKMSSSFQFLAVSSYSQEKNSWQQDGVDGR